MEFFEMKFDESFVAMREGNETIRDSQGCREELQEATRSISPHGNVCREGIKEPGRSVSQTKSSSITTVKVDKSLGKPGFLKK